MTLLYVNVRRTHLERSAVFDAAHRLGHDVVLLCDSVPEGLPGGVRPHRVDTTDDAAVDAVLAGLATVDGVLGFSEKDVRAVSRIAVRLGLPGPGVEAARLARDKVAMRAAVAAVAPGDVPRFAAVTTAGDLGRALDVVGVPGVLKPAASSGSRGIFIVRDRAEARAAHDHLAGFGDLVYEEFMPGSEHSVEGFVHKGEVLVAAITDKRTLEPFRIELAHLQPTGLPEEVQSAVLALTTRVVGALGLDSCAFHLECMVGPDGRVRLVEIGARGGGDFIASHLVGLSTGRSFVEDALLVATGCAPLLGTGPRAGACVRKLVTSSEGVVRTVEGLDEVARTPGVRHIVVEQPVGSLVRQPPADYKSSILGAVITAGDTAATAAAAAERAADAFRITM
ncbi:ATP-grasp domain-containing protein [Actinokineospora diospyrosa]|uniref:Biotin carboxylase n=1 Tax=Actinokineospora diospyrosa TaxID=103728 RepID=A0ABT1IBZ3_9PSEU|nr:ATP-grasp domain-containing protein [Actinokineospora diospyrosa]MCP2270150.1 Biotin carboxylase [Actinokineospora diospyrosa]